MISAPRKPPSGMLAPTTWYRRVALNATKKHSFTEPAHLQLHEWGLSGQWLTRCFTKVARSISPRDIAKRSFLHCLTDFSSSFSAQFEAQSATSGGTNLQSP